MPDDSTIEDAIRENAAGPRMNSTAERRNHKAVCPLKKTNVPSTIVVMKTKPSRATCRAGGRDDRRVRCMT
ncbi:MAG: hypothetical protein L6Q92_07600 [Phycisphaerae bacterium]|nr:hypothetical protein [Phycisphaerae bacterium]